MAELLYRAEYGFLNDYSVYKETDADICSIILFNNDKKCEVDRVQYNNIGEEYNSPMLSWYNLLFCSSTYDASPDYDYMNQAVQNGKKPAATLYVDSEEMQKMIDTMPDYCSCQEYFQGVAYIYHKGKLSDFFDFEKIKEIYIKHGVKNVDWTAVEAYFEKPLSYFANETECGFNLQSGGTREQNIINGLLLGYPVESTIKFIRKN